MTDVVEMMNALADQRDTARRWARLWKLGTRDYSRALVSAGKRGDSLQRQLKAARAEVERLKVIIELELGNLARVVAELEAARARLSEMEQERNETRAALLSVREYLEETPCSGPCDTYGICAKCSAASETYAKGVPSLMVALSERDVALEEIRLLRAELEAARAVVDAVRAVKGCRVEHASGREWFHMPLDQWEIIREAYTAYDAVTRSGG